MSELESHKLCMHATEKATETNKKKKQILINPQQLAVFQQ